MSKHFSKSDCPELVEGPPLFVRLCARLGVPFVARGAGTGLSGGALPVADGVVISLTRLNRILEIDLDSQRIVVEPGVANLDVTRAVDAALACAFLTAPAA